MLKEKNCHPRFHYLAKNILQNEDEIKAFSDRAQEKLLPADLQRGSVKGSFSRGRKTIREGNLDLHKGPERAQAVNTQINIKDFPPIFHLLKRVLLNR